MSRRRYQHPLARLMTTVAIMFLVSTLLIVLAEGAAGIALKRMKSGRPTYMEAYSEDAIRKLYNTEDPELYRQTIAESWRMGETVYSPFVEYRMLPYAGKHFTITEGGWRYNGRSEQDLSRPGPKVFVFGGSTTLGSGVPDDETIPAYLERILQDSGRADVQVFNFGSVAYFSTQERIAFERLLTAGIKPDVAVFIDGLNDFYYCTVPDQSSWNDRLEATTRARARQPLGVELAARSQVAALARRLSGSDKTPMIGWGTLCNSDSDIDRVIARLDTNRRIIDGAAERLGFKALFVQQPVPTYAYDNAKRPYPIQQEMFDFHVNSGKGYPRMAARMAEGKLHTRNLMWLAELEPEGNAYIDNVHYSPAFNRAIAASIAKRIVDDKLLP